MRSIDYSDAEQVFKHLTSQEAVCKQYANKKTLSFEETEKRVKVLADRYNPATAESERGLFMHGGFIVTGEEDEFLGMINTGASGRPGLTEIGVRFRKEAWGAIHQKKYRLKY